MPIACFNTSPLNFCDCLLSGFFDTLSFFGKLLQAVQHRLLIETAGKFATPGRLHALVEKLANLRSIVAIIKWQAGSISQTHRHGSPELCRRYVIDKVWITKMTHPVKRVVGGMINTIIAAEAHITGRNPDVL